MEMLTEEPLYLLDAFNNQFEIINLPEIANSLYEIFSAQGKRQLLLRQVCMSEIAQTCDAPNIFRRNSIASYLLTLFANSEMVEFLKVSIGKELNRLSLMQDKFTQSFEIDPARIKIDAIKENQNRIEELAQVLLDGVFSNFALIPNSLRIICNYMEKMVEEKFPKAGKSAVSGLLFLRVICPAIVTPSSNLVQEVIRNSNIRRGLLLAVKLIQGMANSTTGIFKEAYMDKMNDFMIRNQEAFAVFLRSISV
jgi:hypothetical protein